MSIIFLTQSIELFTNRLVCFFSEGVEMRIDDFQGDDIRIIKMLYETIVNVEEKGLLPNRVSIGLEQKLIGFISVVNDNNIGILALRNPNNDVYWSIMVLFKLAQLYFEIVNAENGIIPKKESYNLYASKFIIKHKTELNDIAERIYKRLHNTNALDYEKQKFLLPAELNTPIAKMVFSKALKKGYLSQKGNYLQWHQSNALLAYLCGRLYSGDYIKNNKCYKDEYIKGNLLFPEAAIESLFYDKVGKPLKNIRKSREGISGKPKGYEYIDNLFNEAS